jgi:iron complex transport system substrate-binding protein
MKILSLLPATTEIICSLGLGENIVGRSHECDFPDFVKQLPVCSEPKFPFDGSSYEIDLRVKAVLAEGLSIYRIHPEKLQELNPDLILTQDQCEVCAVDLKEVEKCLSNMGVKASVLSFSAETLEDILADIQTIADTLGASHKGIELCKNIEDQFAKIRAQTHSKKPVHVEVIEWMDPLMTAGNWMPDLIQIAGGYSTLAESGKHSPFINFEKIETADPKVLMIIPCGYSIKQTQSELDTLLNLPGWTELQAVKNNQVYIADGHQYFNRPGPRIANSAHILAEIIHPQEFTPSLFESGWIKL